jgi:hypothetical protein
MGALMEYAVLQGLFVSKYLEGQYPGLINNER